MLITSAQFLCQHLLARLVLGLRRLRSGAPAEVDAMTWNDWWQKGAASPDTGVDAPHLRGYSLIG